MSGGGEATAPGALPAGLAADGAGPDAGPGPHHLVAPVEPAVMSVATPAALDARAVIRHVAEGGYLLLRDVVSAETAAAIKAAFHERFDPSLDAPGVGTPADAAQRAFQKLVIGGGAQRGYYVPRCVRVLYTPLWTEDVFTAHDALRTLARVRNRLLGRPLDNAVEGVSGGLFTGARLQHYPAGGGFFAPHQDRVAATIARESGVAAFFQLVLVITERGVDFEAGGAFVDSGDVRLDLEAIARPGDVLVYDGRSMHGVDDVDPDQKPDLTSARGRLVAMASLYADMTGGEAYQRYLDRAAFN